MLAISLVLSANITGSWLQAQKLVRGGPAEGFNKVSISFKLIFHQSELFSLISPALQASCRFLVIWLVSQNNVRDYGLKLRSLILINICNSYIYNTEYVNHIKHITGIP